MAYQVELYMIMCSYHSYNFQVRAAYPFAARNPDELNLDEGDVIKVFRQEDEHWWVGEMEDGRQGYFPASYTTMIGEMLRCILECKSALLWWN